MDVERAEHVLGPFDIYDLKPRLLRPAHHPDLRVGGLVEP